MQLGRGRPVKQHDTFELWLWSAPFWGRRFFDWLRPFEPITLDGATNPMMLICGQPGAGKTNLGKHLIRQQVQANLGGIVMDGKAGKESLGQYAIELLAEQGADPERVFICDFFSGLGHPVIDFLYDELNDGVSAYQICEEMVAATALLSEKRSDAGARQLDLAFMSFLSLMLAGRPLGDITLFLTDGGFRTNVVNKTGHPELERFWLGEHAYVKSLPRDALESTRNKWNRLTIHPAIRPCLSYRGKFVDLFDFMQNGGWWIVDLSEDQLKPELQQAIAQLMQYLLKVCTLRRQRVQDKPFFLAIFDEYQQYACSTTHTSLLKLARSQHVGAALLCQDVGGFNDAEMRALGGCGTFVSFNCDYKSAVDMVHQIFQPKGQTYKDWKDERINSVRDEIDQYCALIGEQEPGEAICRVKPDPKGYFLEVPLIPDPDPRSERSFREAVARRWYRPAKK